MKKSSMVLAALVLVALAFGGVGAIAGHCGTGGSAHDPFGSCENGNNLECDETPTVTVPSLAKASAGANGAEVCNDDGLIPPYGRAGVWVSGTNASVFVDGDKDQPGSQGWTRADLRPTASTCKAQVRRGSTGSWYTTGGGTDAADVLNVCNP